MDDKIADFSDDKSDDRKERIRVALTYFLRTVPRTKDNHHQVMCKVRVYTFGKLQYTFNVYVNDGMKPLFLPKHEFRKGQILFTHKDSIRLNEMLKRVRQEVAKIIKDELAHGNVLKKEVVYSRVYEYMRRFNADYVEFLKQQIRYLHEISDDEFNEEVPTNGRVVADITDTLKDSRFVDEVTPEIKQKFLDRKFFDMDVFEKTIKGLVEPNGKPLVAKLVQNQEEYERDMVVRKLASLPIEEIYKQNLWDRQNIFQMFGSIYYDSKVPETYKKIVIRLFEYLEHCHPIEHIDALNAQWLIDFSSFLNTVGYYAINTKNFEPYPNKYDRKRFFLDKKRKEYKPKSLNKLIGITKTVVNGETSPFSFVNRGYIKKLELKRFNLAAITDKKDKDGTRIEHNLGKDEFDELFWFEFNSGKLEEYQSIFNEMNNSENIQISINDLQIAKDLFVLQVTVGGLRGFKELKTVQLLKQSKTEYKLMFFQNKIEDSITNPMNEYTSTILAKYGYKMPVLTRTNARKAKAVESIDMLESHYRSLVKTIGHIINFERDVLVDATKQAYVPIKTIFNPYFSRKTFGTILYRLGVQESDIELFTGHKPRNQSELSSSYIQKNTHENKQKIISVLKIGPRPVQP